jgi:hypothetical protein
MNRLAFLAVVACLCGCALSGAGRADTIITTPAGLKAGDHFFVVFVDSTPHDATSTDITTYNGFITTDAGVIKYPGGTIGMWQVIGSTADINAATPLFTDISTRVYSTANQELAASGTAFLQNGEIDTDQNGMPQVGLQVFTGLNKGVPVIGAQLGEPFGVSTGLSGSKLDGFGLGAVFVLGGNNQALYGYSEFTVGPTSAVPEPASLTLLGIGAVGLVGYGWRRRKRAAA